MATSRYMGVTESADGRWIAAIFKDGRLQHLGVFESELEAASFRDLATLAAHGDLAILNFPELEPEYAALVG